MRNAAAQAIRLQLDDHVATPTSVHCELDGNNNYVVRLTYPAASFTKLSLQSKWISQLPPGHRQYLSLRNADGAVLVERLLSARSDSVEFRSSDATASSSGSVIRPSFVEFLVMGVKHIWTGYDHLLFLFGLLIVTRNLASSARIITCFTLAHSITLAVATLSRGEWIPSRIIEPLIAASIVYVGIENLVRGDDPAGRWRLTFAFGLIHGFGFASVLREMGVGAGGSGITVPLLSFNLGVELGQMAIALVALPLIWKLRKQRLFARRWAPACSAAVVVLGGFWLMQRLGL